MNGFLGTYTINMDEKGRINVPSKFKAILDRAYDSQMVVCVMDDFLIAPRTCRLRVECSLRLPALRGRREQTPRLSNS